MIFVEKAGLSLLALAALAIGQPPVVSAQTILQPNFSSTAGLTLNSSSTTTNSVPADGTVLRLAAATANDTGSVFSNTSLNVASGFSTSFSFRLTSPGGSADPTGALGADGLVFVVQRVGPTALGASGEGMGYLNIGSSIGVEFDTYKNQGAPRNDPDSNHVGVNTNGTMTSALTPVSVTPAFDNGAKWTVWIDYTGSVLEVRLAQDGIRPATALLSQAINLATTIGGNTAYVGFTAATGGAYENHDLLTWVFSEVYSSSGVGLFNWTGSGAWSTAANWNPAAVPGSSDIAFVSAGTASVNDTRSLGALQLNGGTLSGSGTLTLTGKGSSWTVGSMSGSGTTAIASGASLLLSGASTKSISHGSSGSGGRKLENSGLVALDGAGGLLLGDGAAVTNNTGADFDVRSDTGLAYLGSGDAGTFTNSGLFQKSAGAGVSTIGGAAFTNQSGGTVWAKTGTLAFNETVTNNGGTFQASTGATIQFGGTGTRWFDANSVFSGAGAKLISGGTTTFNGAFTAQNLTFAGGTLLGPATLHGTMNWTGGSWIGNSTFTVAADGTLTLDGSSDKSLYHGSSDSDGRVLSNSGTVTLQGGGKLLLGDGAQFVNQAGGTLDLRNDGTIGYADSGNPGTLTNHGTLLKSAGTGTSTIDVPFVNSGSIVVASGTLAFTSTFSSTNSGITLANHGGFSVAGTLDLGTAQLSGTGTITAAEVIAGGLVSPGSSPGQLTLTGDLTLLNTSTSLFELGGTTQGATYDFLSVAGTAQLGGELRLSFVNDFRSSVLPTQTFTLITASSLTGLFANVSNGQRLFMIDGNGSFQVNYGAGSAFTSLTNSLVLSDFSPVPEPSTWALMGVGAVFVVLRLRRKRA